MRIGIVPHTGKETAMDLSRELAHILDQRGVEHRVILAPSRDNLAHVDLVIVLGGDGTLLNTARLASHVQVPVFGVNVGHLGFLTEVETDGLFPALDRLLAGEFTIEKRMLISASIEREGREIASHVALNDFVVTRGTFARIIEFSIFADGQPVSDYVGDGVIVATPTGSTAYSLAAGGPIIEPLLESICITPICAHSLAARSVVIRPEVEVQIRLNRASESVMLTIDGHDGFPLLTGDRVTIRRAGQWALFARLGDRGFFQVLHSRLRMPQMGGGIREA
ncbi:MAG TPA: NAD(+)/NADH kinase [Limnochordia bacterium]|nr:NAD(+)/NADH kinase [Limnochordia bacterium]